MKYLGPFTLETDATSFGLRNGLMQVRDDMHCGHDKVPDNATLQPSLLSTKWHYRKIEQEALGILHGLKSSTIICFAKEICIITDHKPLVAIISKDMATLSQHL